MTTREDSIGVTKALVVELVLVVLLVGYGSFSVFRFVLLFLLACQSLWIRGLRWSDVGLRRPARMGRTVLHAVAATLLILLGLRFVIAPTAAWLTGDAVDLSALGDPGDARALALWLGQAWTLAAFGEEMVFRGYLIHRIGDLAGDRPLGRAIALLASSALFGLAHLYQGWAGVIAAGVIGVIMALLYFASRRNLWAVIVCHALVDTVALLAIYFGHLDWLLP